MNFVTVPQIAVLLLGCSSPSDTVKKVFTDIRGVPPSGRYVSSTGEEFKVSSTGPNALSIWGSVGKTCVRFWQEKTPPPTAVAQLDSRTEAVRLRGQQCDNKTFNDLAWRASYSRKSTSLILIYPPGAFRNEAAKPFELRYVGKEQ